MLPLLAINMVKLCGVLRNVFYIVDCGAVPNAELLTVRFGMEMPLFRNPHQLILECDSLMAVKEIGKGLNSLSP